MKICLYSPYVPKHVGGGEKYFFDVAKTLMELGHDVCVAVTHDLSGHTTFSSGKVSDSSAIRHKYEQFLGYSLTQLQFVPAPINGAVPVWQKMWWTRQWDVLYYATDGSLFFSLAKRNILHIQIPFTDAKNSLIERLKLQNWSIKNTNSGFTKKVIEQSWRTQVTYVHYPMIDPPTAPKNLLSQKEKIILHVGRFFRTLHSKKQDVLVEIFAQLLQQHPKESKGWRLVFIGSIEEQEYFDEVKRKAAGLPIELLQLGRQELWEYYQRARIYWHATGFGLDENQEPAKMEHFGISTVEAMSMGCVPVVIGQGGQVEVVGPRLKELLWKTPAECIAQTLKVMTNPKFASEKAQEAREQAQEFGPDRFREILVKMIA